MTVIAQPPERRPTVTSTRRRFWLFVLALVVSMTGGAALPPAANAVAYAGVLHGWVGVEASNRVAQQGTLAVHWHVDV
jgi:hypothetical protein